MAAPIQIMIAGTLLLAWIWVLGRPLFSARKPTAYEEFLAKNPDRAVEASPEPANASAATESTEDPLGLERPMPGLLGTARTWWQRPPHVWRRQLLMATMLATFVSFFLAVALRNSLGNTFLYLFVMMVLGLVLHLGIAAYVGGQMLQANRATTVRSVQAQVRPGAMSINADQVGGAVVGQRRSILEEDVSLFEFDQADVGGVEGDSAFNLAADIASALEKNEEAAPIDEVAEVNELIENAWADALESATTSEPPIGEEVEPEVESEVEVEPEHRTEAQTQAEAEAEAEAEAIFRRAAKDEPSRPRRKPKAIYIESQLDDEPGDEPKAVNYP